MNAPEDTETFPVTERSRVRRMPGRGSYDKAAVHSVLDGAFLCHVAYCLDGRPFCTPTIHWRSGDVLYWHGSAASRMLKRQAEGLDVCLTVSLLDGLVLARSAFHHSVNYRSAMCFGRAFPIADEDEKRRALEAMLDRLYPGRNQTLRPIAPHELKATRVNAMRIDEAAVKVRDAGVADDEADYDLPVWAGVIPVRTVIGAADPCPRLQPGVSRPDHLADWTEGRRLDEMLAG